MTFRGFLILIPLFIGQISFGQDSHIKAKKVLEIFKSSIIQSSKSKIEADSNPWLSNNSDSSFFKSDTVFLIQNNPNQNYARKKSCAFIGWTFYKKNRFIQLDIDYCNEPPTRRVTTTNDFYSMTITEEYNNTIIKTYRKDKLIDSFRVLGYKIFNDSFANEDVSILTLLRKK